MSTSNQSTNWILPLWISFRCYNKQTVECLWLVKLFIVFIINISFELFKMTADKKNSLCEEKSSFTEVNLSEIERKKLPKRLVYFSDGVLEEYSTDEEELDGENSDTQPLVDPKSLPWVPYFGYLIWWLGSRTLAVCDYLGENLAWFLGITTPKFQYELDQYEKIVKEEEEFKKYIKSENAGWTINDVELESKSTVELQPKAIPEKTMDISKNFLDENYTVQNKMDV